MYDDYDSDEEEEELEEISYDYGKGPSRRTRNTKLYDMLGVPSSIESKWIPQVAETLLHDRGDSMSPQEIQGVMLAKDVLKNPDRRIMYDRFGERSLDICRSLHCRKSRRHTKTKNTLADIIVELEEVYTGTYKEFDVPRKRVCKDCNGTGLQRTSGCGYCDGSGIVAVKIGAEEYIKVPCDRCQGKGTVLNPLEQCADCHGEKVVQDLYTVKLEIPPGTKDGYRFRFEKEGNAEPIRIPGDLEIEMHYNIPLGITLKDNDVFIRRTISFGESLTGYRIMYTQFDGSRHLLVSAPGEVTRDGSKRRFPDMGMPMYNAPNLFGTLVVEFSVKPPPPLSPYDIEMVLQYLPHGEIISSENLSAGERRVAIDFHESQITQSSELPRSDHPESDEDDQPEQQECSNSVF